MNFVPRVVVQAVNCCGIITYFVGNLFCNRACRHNMNYFRANFRRQRLLIVDPFPRIVLAADVFYKIFDALNRNHRLIVDFLIVALVDIHFNPTVGNLLNSSCEIFAP